MVFQNRLFEPTSRHLVHFKLTTGVITQTLSDETEVKRSFVSRGNTGWNITVSCNQNE